MYAQRLERISPFRVVELLERAKALEADGAAIVHFEVGEPDFPTAAPIVKAGHRALDAGATKYTQALGIPALRERIAAYYGERCDVDVDPERVVVTGGASGALLLLGALLLDPGDELLLTEPGYPCNEVFAHLVNGIPRPVAVHPENGFRPTPSQLGAAWGPAVRGLLAASPANPTGAVLPAAELAELAAAVRAREGFMILDEIYQGLTYAGIGGAVEPGCRTGLAVADDLFVLNSFSKYFGMTGWRLGWMVVPEAAVAPVARLAQNLFISPPALAQHAALAAFEPAAMAVHEARREAFAERLGRLSRGLEALGFSIPVRPSGAFYVYADVSRSGMGAMELCWRLLEEYGVAATPGVDFGGAEPERFVRFAFTTGTAEIDEGLERMGRALADWGVA
ncbi:MAG: aminotransferase class I/II-fold pyridoxal phosphate-dependent enzyme [Pseudomonadota bacterium]